MLRFENPLMQSLTQQWRESAFSVPSTAWGQWRLRLPAWATLVLPLALVGVIVLPLFYLLWSLVGLDVALWEHLWETVLPTMLLNTLRLVLGVGVASFILGAGMAWLVTAYDFPLRRFFEHALLLPLAIPAYVMGFVFMGIFEYAGPVQSQWREWFGAEAPFPNPRSAGGVIIVMTLVLYPYVYILARAAFREQGASTFEAARVMGYSRFKTFFFLVLPLARPSLVAGTMLAMMEALTDYGTVRFFNYPTLTEGVVRLWSGHFDREGATQLASLLLFFALGLIVLERILRGQARYYQQGGRGRCMSRKSLQGLGRWLALALCLTVLGAAFIVPVGQLVSWVLQEAQQPSVGGWREVYGDYIYNSVRLAGLAAGLVMGLGLIVAHGVRTNSLTGRRLVPRALARLVSLGYAMPGAVIAVGVLTLVAPIDHQVTDWVEQNLGRSERSLLFTGTMLGLLYAYLVRFMSIGFNSVDSSLTKVTPTMEQAARVMGARPWRVLWRIYLPLISSGMTAGAILVFVDVMKELPTTLMLRPFGMDTLALWGYFLASESFWQAASIPSLTILVVGLLPVFLLMRMGDRRAHD